MGKECHYENQSISSQEEDSRVPERELVALVLLKHMVVLVILPSVLIPSFSEVFQSDILVVEWSNGKS